MEKELTPKQQTSEAVRQAETVLIITGQHPSVDQVASTVALANILRKFGKKVNAVISDDIPAGAKFLPTNLIDRQMGGLRDFIIEVDLAKAEVDTLRYTIENGKLNVHIAPFAGGFTPNDVSFGHGDYHYDLVIVLGVASYSRIDKVYGQNVDMLSQTPLVNIDFHRSNEQYGAINLIEPNAAGLGEILVALSESLQTGLIDTPIATAVLTGIYAATDRFTASHTTSKALTVAAQMVSVGADQQQVVRGLYRDGGAKRQPSSAPAQPRRNDHNSGTESQPPTQLPNRPQAIPVAPASQPIAPRSAPNTAEVEQRNQLDVEDDSQLQVSHTHQPSAATPIASPPHIKQSVPSPVASSAPQPVSPGPNPVQPTSHNPLESESPASIPTPDLPPSPELSPSLEELVQAPLSGVDAQSWESQSEVEIEVDSPAVTDPDDQPAHIPAPQSSHQAVAALQPEPLINDVDQPRSTAAPEPPKNTNPTNNPVFANRLS
jgi:hypothetical protein